MLTQFDVPVKQILHGHNLLYYPRCEKNLSHN